MDRSGAFFDDFAERFDTIYDGRRNAFMRWVDATFRSDMYLRFEKCFEFLGELNGKTVFDVGCGSGPYIAEALRRNASQVTGLDPAPGMLDLARRRVAQLGKTDKVAFLPGYFPDVRPKHKHDVAIVTGVMDYVEDPVSFLRALRESVTVGASVTFPCNHWFRGPLRKVRYALRKVDLWLYSRQRLEAIIREAGFSRYTIHKIPGAGMDFVVWIKVS